VLEALEQQNALLQQQNEIQQAQIELLEQQNRRLGHIARAVDARGNER
jgi:hypothetical protein